jgi:hypothetical protein
MGAPILRCLRALSSLERSLAGEPYCLDGRALEESVSTSDARPLIRSEGVR